MGMIPKNSLQNQTLPLLFPNPDFPNPNPWRCLPFPENPAPKSPKFPNFPIPAARKAGKSILESQKRGKKPQKNPNCASKLFYSPQIQGFFLGRAGPRVPWLRPEENPGIFLIQIRGISGFFWHQRSFLCRISQAILFRKYGMCCFGDFGGKNGNFSQGLLWGGFLLFFHGKLGKKGKSLGFGAVGMGEKVGISCDSGRKWWHLSQILLGFWGFPGPGGWELREFGNAGIWECCPTIRSNWASSWGEITQELGEKFLNFPQISLQFRGFSWPWGSGSSKNSGMWEFPAPGTWVPG